MRIPRFAVASALAASLVTACSGGSSSESAPQRASDGTPIETTECSTGPAQYGPQNQPPYRGPGADTTSIPMCAPRCGEPRLERSTGGPSSGTYAYESLPSGACAADTRCLIGVSNTQTCEGQTFACNVSTAECDCEDGQWRCYILTQGAAMCAPCGFPDAGG